MSVAAPPFRQTSPVHQVAAIRRRARTAPVTGERRAADQRTLVALHQQHPEVRAQALEALMPLAVMVARRMPRSVEPLADIEQVAMVGLLKAVRGFDLDRGCSFAAYAVPTIRGELTRYFRDSCWAAHVPRQVKDRALQVRRLEAREPGITDEELRRRLELDDAQLADAREAAGAMFADEMPVLHEPPSDDADRTRLQAEARIDVGLLSRGLAEQERLVLALSFVAGQSQRTIGKQLDVSQMQVSRIRRRALRAMAPVPG